MNLTRLNEVLLISPFTIKLAPIDCIIMHHLSILLLSSPHHPYTMNSWEETLSAALDKRDEGDNSMAEVYRACEYHVTAQSSATSI